MSCIRLFKLFLLLCSVLSGALFAIVWHNYQVAVLRINNLHSPVGHNIADNNDPARQLDNSLQPVHYQQWLNSKGYVSLRMPHEELSYGANRSNFESEANFLFNQTKVLCLVLTRSRNRARALLHTWTRHCNQVAFYGKFSDSKNNKLVKIDFLDESIFSTRTFCRAFVDLISKHNDFHWLLITTDQTYAIVENLRHYLSPVNASLPYYIGRPVHHYFLGLYNAFDSGIVLSLAAVNLLANGIFRHDDSCVNIATNGVVYSGSFDAFISMELAKRGCKPSNTLDTQGSPGSGSRFHPYMPEKHILPELLSVFDSYWSSNVLPIQSGLHCCRYVTALLQYSSTSAGYYSCLLISVRRQ